MDEEETKFVVLVSYCANKCQLAGTSFRSTVARHLNDIMGELFEVYSLLVCYYMCLPYDLEVTFV